MPGFNGTGPLGEGPMTGWGMGNCGTGRRADGASNNVAARPLGWGRGLGRRGFRGRGRGYGFGRGMGWRFGLRGARWANSYPAGNYPNPATKDQESLAARAQWLKDELAAVERQLSGMSANED